MVVGFIKERDAGEAIDWGKNRDFGYLIFTTANWSSLVGPGKPGRCKLYKINTFIRDQVLLLAWNSILGTESAKVHLYRPSLD